MGYRKILIKNGHIFDGDRFFDADILRPSRKKKEDEKCTEHY